MIKKIHLVSICLAISICPSGMLAQAESPARTIVNSSTAARKIVGKHKLNLQWIGWENWSEFGNLTVTNRRGMMFVNGNQTKGEDYLQIDGKIISIEDKQFTFKGKIVTQVSSINQGQACERNGEMVFKITENRKYWRLQQMQSPCDTTTDYVDIFMR